MQTSKIAGASGLGWRPRANGPVAYWVADRATVSLGYPVKTVRLWPPSSQPHPGTPDARDQQYIADECARLQAEMVGWREGRCGARVGDITKAFDGSVASLASCYQRDGDSEYAGTRFKTREYYDHQLRAITRTVGARVLAKLGGRDFKRWFEDWSKDADGSRHIPRAAAFMTQFRSMIRYGVTLLADPQCIRISALLAEMKFKSPGRRKSTVTAAQAVAIRTQAHRMGLPKVALGQALQYDLLLRQKDVIGEMIPLDEPGLSDIVMGGRKWVVGLHWREVSPDLKLTHTLSKSLKGREALATVMDDAKEKEWDLTRYPMVMEELALIPPEQRVGPIVTDHRTGLPYGCDDSYRRDWRKVADAVGVPKSVQNRDSRAGGITETIRATGGNVNAARIAAGHSKIETTQIYDRDEAERMAEVADLRAARRKKNGG